VLLAEDGGYFDEYHTRPIAYYVQGKSWVNNHAHVLTNKPGFDLKWIFYSLVHKNILPSIKGTTRTKLNHTELKRILIPIPELNEQQKISSIVSKVDELIQKTDQIIEQTQRLKKGLMQRLFSDSFLTHFQLFSIEEIKASIPNAISMGPFGSSIKTDNFVPSGIPVIRGVNLSKEPFNLDGFVFIRKEKANELRSANAFPGDIVFTHRGTLGQVGVIPEDTKYDRFVISQSQMKLTCDRNKVIPLYAYYFFKSQRGQDALLSNISATGVPAIGQPTTTLRQIKIPLPVLSEQQKVVTILSKADNLIKNRQSYKGWIENLKRGVMQKLLTGKIRVKA
jgi:restriction endonuclease S subunit